MVALSILISAITSFSQTNIGLAQVGMLTKLCQYIPLAPTFRNFIFIAVADVGSLPTGLFSRIVTGRYAKSKHNLITVSVLCLILDLVFFAKAVLDLQFAFFYYQC
jgi:hypothetical protein